MCSLNHFLGRQKPRVWELLRSTDNEVLEVTEIRAGHNQPNSLRVIHSEIAKAQISQWTANTDSAEMASGGDRCLLRVVWVPLFEEQMSYNVSAHMLAQINQHFRLEKVHEHYSSTYTWSTCSAQRDFEIRAYYVGRQPLIHLSWSRKDGSSTTNAICIAKEPKIKFLKEILECDFVQQLMDQEMLPGFMVAVMLVREIDQGQEPIKDQVREVEVRTGFHNWESRFEKPAAGDLNSLSAKMSGCETKTASIIRKIETVRELSKFIRQQADSSLARGGSNKSSHEALYSHLDNLMQRVRSQHIEANFFAQRTKSQLTAIFHLITQNDVTIGHEIARDSRLLALAAQRDSSSMKSLAVVTMFFLPGTFVSSLFSIPLFDWDTSDPTQKYRREYWVPIISLYATTTLPLTLLTFAVWGFWLWVQSLQNRRQREAARAQLDGAEKPTEVDVLAARRTVSVDGDK